jgi:hypothetical protein
MAFAKTMKYQISASPFALQIFGAHRRIGRHPAVGIDQGGLYQAVQPVMVLASDILAGRKPSGPAEWCFRPS